MLSVCLLVQHWSLEGGREKERGHAIDIKQCTAVSEKKNKLKEVKKVFSSRLNF